MRIEFRYTCLYEDARKAQQKQGKVNTRNCKDNKLEPNHFKKYNMNDK